jgi:hypothetical protein
MRPRRGETPIGGRSIRWCARLLLGLGIDWPSLRLAPGHQASSTLGSPESVRDMNLDLEGLRQRKLIGYGAGLATLLTLRATPLELEFIVDDKRESQGTTLLGIPIVPPTELHRVNLPEYCVIIFAYTGTAIRAIQDKLAATGLNFPDNLIDCSLLHFHSYRRRLKAELGLEASADLFAMSRLSSIYTYPQNLSGAAGTWLYLELVKELNQRSVAGDIAELGVFEGGSTLCSLLAGREILSQRKLHLFDSFMESPELSSRGPTQRRSESADLSLTKVRNCFALFENVRIHPGIFRDTLRTVRDETFALAYFDADLYEPAVECCRFFYDKLKPGGMMLFHDYCADEPELPRGARVPFSGVKKAVDEFFAGREDRLLLFPETTHALAIKAYAASRCTPAA